MRLEVRGPVAGLSRVAAHQVEPALRLEGEFPSTLHVDGVAHRQLIRRTGVVCRLGPVLGAGPVARARADHVQVGHRCAGIAELVLCFRIEQQRLGVAVQRRVYVTDVPVRSVVALLVLVRHRSVGERCGAQVAEAAASRDISRAGRVVRAPVPPVVTRRVAIPKPRRRVDESPPAALTAVESPIARVVEQLKNCPGAGVHAGIRDDEDHLPIALVAGAERPQVVGVERPKPGVDHPLGRIGRLLPLVLLHVGRPPEVEVRQRHLRGRLRHAPLGGIAVAVRRRPRRRQIGLGFRQLLNDRLMDLLNRRALRSRVGLLLRRQEQRHAIVHFSQPQIRVRPQELGLGEIVRLRLRVRCRDVGPLGEHEIGARDHRVRGVPIASREARARVPGDEVRALGIEVGLAIVGAGHVGGELRRGPIRLALQPAQRVIDGDCGAVQIGTRLVEGVRRRKSLGILDQEIGTRPRQPDGERHQRDPGFSCHGSSLLIVAQKVMLRPRFHVRVRGYAPMSIPPKRASPPMLFTSGSNPE